jgi:arylsulfatase
MGNNEYTVRPWHLPEYCHPTNWTTREMCRTIQRRDPTRPAFWYCSYIAPHPPVTPPRENLDMYEHFGVDDPYLAPWSADPADLPYAMRAVRDKRRVPQDPQSVRYARMGLYDQCTYIDLQVRLLIGTLREEGLLDSTIVMFVCDHGDMLGNHNLWAKPAMFEHCARIPMILVPAAGDTRFAPGTRDDRLTELRDVMPTLLELCGITIPTTVEGIPLAADGRRDHLYCEHYEGDIAMRMIRKGSHKLIYYPVGNRTQLFDLESDPRETEDLSADARASGLKEELTALLVGHLYGTDAEWIQQGRLIGLPDRPFASKPNRGLSGQRGWR